MRTSLKPTAVGAAGIASALLIWQLAALSRAAGGSLPQLGRVIGELGSLVGSPDFWSAAGATIGIALLGLAAAGVCGVTVGILVGSFEPVRYATRVVLEFLKPVPPIVILPLVVLVLGPTGEMSWFLVFLGCLLPITMQTVDGVHSTDPVARDTARSYGMPPAEILSRIVLPSALPYIGTAVRVTAPASLIITVVAGLLGGGPGLGQSLYLAQAGGDYATMYALVVILGVLGLLFQAATRAAERRLLHWHESYREAVH
ncbi:ABC-type nitrate/sulfonate/bicarbonate transport system permease component [Sinomonas atrocyanea]|uniref:ABC transporter permease n=1 Tax=Sinomonas atrocyanea TaxID=37927 RepID=UPI00278AEF12|nr:ABC transporter permease subunit [Sinomonas atrocyanea]MDQ0258254.1 ABC-type nitrate/sulfonate/bicarbonate transport system permease component [Sinomonas atrocyanea]